MSYNYCDASALERTFSVLGLFVKENNLMKVEHQRTKNQQKEVDILVKKLNKLGINQSNLFKKRSYKRKKYDRKINKLLAKIKKYPLNDSPFFREIGEINFEEASSISDFVINEKSGSYASDKIKEQVTGYRIGSIKD